MEDLLRSLLVASPCLDTAVEDVLRTLIMPPPLSSISVRPSHDEPQYHVHAALGSGEGPAAQVPSTSSSELKTQPTLQPGHADTSTKARKKKKRSKRKQKQEQHQSMPEQGNITKPALLSQPAGIEKAKKHKRYHFYHPDRPKAGLHPRTAVSYEDLYDDVPAQQSDPLSVGLQDQTARKSNPEAKHTCFFWYHGACERSQDRKGCQLRHALQDPPKMVEAPPGFVHPEPCGLQWCKGDGFRKRQKAEVAAEQKRYFEVNVPDDTSARETADLVAENEVDCYLKGFEGIGHY